MNIKRSAGKTVSWTWKIILFLISFVLVLFVSWELRLWSGSFTRYFILTGNWALLAFIMIIVTAVSMIFNKILQWQFRLETKPMKKQRRRIQ